MKFLSLILVLALAAAAYVLPQPTPVEPGPAAGVEEPAVAVCAIEEGAGRSTEVAILSTVDGPTRLTLFAGGDAAGSVGQDTGATGSVVFPVVDVAAVGTVGGLVEMPVASSAAGTVVTGSESMSAESCAVVPAPQALITGGSTVSGETFVLHLMNPFAGEAIAELVVRSEVGIESNDSFESVIIPSRASTLVDLTDLIPGRESVSITIDTIQGRVMGVGRQGANGESAVWKAVAPAQDWFVPVPGGSGPKELLIATSANNDVDYQVDLYGPEGFQEGFISGTLGPRGQDTIDLSAISTAAMGVRVVSAGPVVPTLWIESETGLAATTGAQTPSTRWFLPGASAVESGWASVVILNTGIEDGMVTLRPLRRQTYSRSVDLASDAVLEIGLDTADGYLIESTGPVVVAWSAQRGEAALIATGVPIADG